MNLKDFHNKLNRGDYLEAYETAKKLKEKYLLINAPTSVARYIESFIEEYETYSLNKSQKRSQMQKIKSQK